MSLLEFEDAAVDVTVHEAAGSVVKTLLHPTTLTLAESRIAVIGPNGSGKSTLARLVNGLVEPTRGRVVVNGLDVTREGPQVRRQVGFVFTDPSAQLVMPTVAEDVALSLRRHHRDKAERAAAVERVLERYGLAGLGERSVHTLSGGQRQLLALAGVLATEPAVLVADEPTTLLDLRNSRSISELLFSLDQQLLLLTHDLDLASRCERALVVDEGRIVADDDAASAVAYYRRTA